MDAEDEDELKFQENTLEAIKVGGFEECLFESYFYVFSFSLTLDL